MCYQGKSARHSIAYEPSPSRGRPDKRGSRNLFKTALAKLTRKHKERKAINDNVYEVIVIYKDKHDEQEDIIDNDKSNKRIENSQCQKEISIIKDEAPKAPPRSRSRPPSRNSCKNYGPGNQSPTPPPRSRPQSRSSYKNLSFDNMPPTPPPRSRPQSRNSCKNVGLEHNKTPPYLQDVYTERKVDQHKPPIPPPRSPFVRERKKVAAKLTENNHSSRKSVSLADLETELDYIDIEEMEGTGDGNEKPKSFHKNKLHNSDEIVACNERMDSRWATVLNSSSLSLSMHRSGADCAEVKETHLGPVHSLDLSAAHRTQSYSGLAGHQLDRCGVPENSLGQLPPKDRVKLSLDRLDIPSWYTAKQNTENPLHDKTHRPTWKKGSFTDIQKPPSKSSPSSPVPLSSPPSIRSNWRNNLREKTLPPPSPNSSTPKDNLVQQQPYQGWRSLEKLPTFLPTNSPSRMEEERKKCSNLEARLNK